MSVLMSVCQYVGMSERNFSAQVSKQKLFRMSTGCQKDRKTDQTDRHPDRQIEDRKTFQLSYQNKRCSECQQDVKKSVRQIGRYTVRQADRVTDRQNDSMTVWQNSRAAKEPALVYFIPKLKKSWLFSCPGQNLIIFKMP